MQNFFHSPAVRKDENARTLSYFCTKDIVMISKDIIRQLIEESDKEGSCDIRISLHKDPSDSFHNMILLQRKGNYYGPHKHDSKAEVYHLIEGKMAVFIFNESGSIIASKILSPEKNFIFRIPPNQHHVSIPLTDHAIFHESKPGPFLGKGDSIFAKWAPEMDDIEGGKKYFKGLLKTLEDS